MQKRRLASASQEALSKRQKLHMAQIMGARKSVTDDLAIDMMTADSRYASLLAVRGLCVGDVIRIIADGPYCDVHTEITDIEHDFRLAVVVNGTTVVLSASEAELFAAKTSAKVPRRKEKV
jgi:hypothetical protein